MLLTDETTALAALTAAFGDRWTFTTGAGKWRAVPPPDFAFAWGAYPAVTADDPIALARVCGEVQAYEDIATMAEEDRLWRAEQEAAAREARERSWAAARRSPFLSGTPVPHPSGCR